MAVINRLDRNRPVRVLHVTQPTTEGTATVVRSLVQFGLAEGHDVTVASPQGGGLSEWALAEGASWVELELVRALSVRDLHNVLAVRRLMSDFDLVHLHSSKAGAVGRFAAATVRTRPQIVFIPHGWSWLVGGRAASSYRGFERWATKLCDQIVAVSEEELHEGLCVLGTAQRLVLIPNSVDTERFSPHGQVAPRNDLPLIVCLGRLSRQKGQDLAVRALAGMRSKQARLRFVGSGPDEASLRDLARTHGVASRVEFVGNASAAPHLRAADIVLLPSRWEGLALALLEAMSVGSAIVASDRGARVALGNSGIICSISDESRFVAEAARALDRLVSDPDQRRRLRRATRNRAVDLFSIERCRREYGALWAQMTGVPEATQRDVA